MKEFLNPLKDGSYELSNDALCEGSIEVPRGACIARFYPKDPVGLEFENSSRQWWDDEKMEWVDYSSTEYFNSNKFSRIVWQRSETEHLMQGKNGERLMESVGQLKGMKYDNDKPRHSLLPKGTVNAVIDVLEFGAKKYEVNNWQKVDNAKERYYNAAMRHIDRWWNGEKLDPETNIHHLAHAATSLFFLIWFDENGE